MATRTISYPKTDAYFAGQDYAETGGYISAEAGHRAADLLAAAGLPDDDQSCREFRAGFWGY